VRVRIVDQEWSCALKNPNPSVWWRAGVAVVFGWDLGRVKLLEYMALNEREGWIV